MADSLESIPQWQAETLSRQSELSRGKAYMEWLNSCTQTPLQAEQRGWLPKVSRASPRYLIKGIAWKTASEVPDTLTSQELPTLKAGFRKLYNSSGQSSPTGSAESQGSSATLRSIDSLHRPTPIPADAASSFAG